jgi:hypothetical protein
MAATVEAELSRAQKAGVVIKVNDEAYVVAWRFDRMRKPFVGIDDVKLVDGEWLDIGGNAWPADAVASLAAAITEIAADRTPPPLTDPLHVELAKREKSPHDHTRVITIDNKSVLVVYPMMYDGTPSVMVRNYEHKKRAWDFTCYDIIRMPVAIQIAAYVMNTR